MNLFIIIVGIAIVSVVLLYLGAKDAYEIQEEKENIIYHYVIGKDDYTPKEADVIVPEIKPKRTYKKRVPKVVEKVVVKKARKIKIVK